MVRPGEADRELEVVRDAARPRGFVLRPVPGPRGGTINGGAEASFRTVHGRVLVRKKSGARQGDHGASEWSSDHFGCAILDA